MMKALIRSLTTRKPLRAPIRPPTASAIRSETGTISHSGVSVIPMPIPDAQNNTPTTMALRPATDSTDRSM